MLPSVSTFRSTIKFNLTILLPSFDETSFRTPKLNQLRANILVMFNHLGCFLDLWRSMSITSGTPNCEELIKKTSKTRSSVPEVRLLSLHSNDVFIALELFMVAILSGCLTIDGRVLNRK